MGRLDGKVALITGASSGLGKGTAHLFAKEGAKIAICARRVEKLKQTAEECIEAGAEVHWLPADVTKKDNLKNLVTSTMEKFGRIDILMNNAVSTTQYVSIMDNTQEMWDNVMKTAVEATWNLMRLCQPIMKKQKFGRIINLSSDAAFKGPELFGAYAVAKAGVRAMTMVAAREWSPEITVNSIGLTKSYKDGTPQESIDETNSDGGFCVICHPNLRQEACPVNVIGPLVKELTGYVGLEILNGCISQARITNNIPDAGSAMATDLWDELLSSGRKLWGFGFDDYHAPYEFARVWTVFLSRSEKIEDIKAAAQAGSLYVSTGLVLKSLELKDDTISVCANFPSSEEDTIKYEFFGSQGRLLHSVNTKKAEYVIPKDEKYVRVEAAAGDGSRAWVQPILRKGS